MYQKEGKDGRPSVETFEKGGTRTVIDIDDRDFIDICDNVEIQAVAVEEPMEQDFP